MYMLELLEEIFDYDNTHIDLRVWSDPLIEYITEYGEHDKRTRKLFSNMRMLSKTKEMLKL